jgi:hypothetical protein
MMDFREIQQFRQAWFWVFLVLLDVVLCSLFGSGMGQQLLFHQPWGDQPLSDPALFLTGAIVALILGGLTYFFYTTALITEVKADGVHLRFWPMITRHIPFETIKACAVRNYGPITEYGGWGIRFSRRGLAYTVTGNQGVQLDFLKGRSLLIGSQQAAELVEAINRHR